MNRMPNPGAAHEALVHELERAQKSYMAQKLLEAAAAESERSQPPTFWHVNLRDRVLRLAWGAFRDPKSISVLAMVAAWVAIVSIPSAWYGSALQRAKMRNMVGSAGAAWSVEFVNSLDNAAPGELYDALAGRIDSFRRSHFKTIDFLASDLRDGYASCQNLRGWVLTRPETLPFAERQWLGDRCVDWSEGFEQGLIQLAEEGQPKSILSNSIDRLSGIAEALRARKTSTVD